LIGILDNAFKEIRRRCYVKSPVSPLYKGEDPCRISPFGKGDSEPVRQPAFFVKPANAKASRSSLPRRRESRKPRKDWIPAFAGMTFLRSVPCPVSSDNLLGEDAGQPNKGDFSGSDEEILFIKSKTNPCFFRWLESGWKRRGTRGLRSSGKRPAHTMSGRGESTPCSSSTP
jgi:hypothetical protein